MRITFQGAVLDAKVDLSTFNGAEAFGSYLKEIFKRTLQEHVWIFNGMRVVPAAIDDVVLEANIDDGNVSFFADSACLATIFVTNSRRKSGSGQDFELKLQLPGKVHLVHALVT
jgi:hypothetical protein